MKIAYFSPLNARSGIVDYSGKLLENLCRNNDVDVFAETISVDLKSCANHKMLSKDHFQLENYDAVVYQVGNENIYAYYYDVLLKHPGIIILHDYCIYWLARAFYGRRSCWRYLWFLLKHRDLLAFLFEITTGLFRTVGQRFIFPILSRCTHHAWFDNRRCEKVIDSLRRFLLVINKRLNPCYFRFHSSWEIIGSGNTLLVHSEYVKEKVLKMNPYAKVLCISHPTSVVEEEKVKRCISIIRAPVSDVYEVVKDGIVTYRWLGRQAFFYLPIECDSLILEFMTPFSAEVVICANQESHKILCIADKRHTVCFNIGRSSVDLSITCRPGDDSFRYRLGRLSWPDFRHLFVKLLSITCRYGNERIELLEKIHTFQLTTKAIEQRKENSACLRSHDFVTMLFGSVSQHKRVDKALAGFLVFHRRFPNSKLVIAGNLNDDCPMIDAFSRYESIIFTGYVEEEALSILLRRADAGINLRGPSTGGTSGALIKMLSYGIPCIVSDYAENRELPDVVVKVPHGNEESGEISRALTALYTNVRCRQDLAKAGTQFVQYTTYNRLSELILSCAIEDKKKQ